MKCKIWTKNHKSLIITFVILLVVFEGISIIFEKNLNYDNKKQTKSEARSAEINGAIIGTCMIVGISVAGRVVLNSKKSHMKKMQISKFYKGVKKDGQNEKI